jgi:hypothetical protein
MVQKSWKSERSKISHLGTFKLSAGVSDISMEWLAGVIDTSAEWFAGVGDTSAEWLAGVNNINSYSSSLPAKFFPGMLTQR